VHRAVAGWTSADGTARPCGTLRTRCAAWLVNPLPWAILLGALASVAAAGACRARWKRRWLLADAASPVALFTIGAVLARSQMRAALHDHPMPLIATTCRWR
jgi:predicted permease